MHMNPMIRSWIERLKLLCMLPRSNRSMNILPPNFILRDPVTHLLRKTRQMDNVCSLILIGIDQYEPLIRVLTNDIVKEIHGTLEVIIRETIYEFVDESRLIGVKRLQPNLYGVFIQEDEFFFARETDALSYRIRTSLQNELDGELAERELNVHLLCAAAQLDCELEDEQLAIYQSVQEAWAIATEALPYHFNSLKQEIHQIIKDKDIFVLAQPIMNLQTGELYGWEILTRGPINTMFHLPTSLFDYADKVNLLSELEFVVIQKAIEEIAVRKIYDQVFINITAITLCHPHFIRYLSQWIKEYSSVEPCQIIFEITEQHIVHDFSQTTQVIRKFRELGFRFAVDDAGTGYSNLQSILELVPDIIKIDKSLIQEIDRIAAKESMLKALLTFAKEIDCQVVAEGIEREEEANVLFRNEVEMGQGYYFAKPERFWESDQRIVFEEMKQKLHRLRARAAL